MAVAKQILSRRKTVRNIRKITRTMEMVSTARFRQVHRHVTGARPYTDQVTRMVARLTRAVKDDRPHALLRPQLKAPNDAFIVLTSNRGLCGGFNQNVIHLAMDRHRRLTRRGRIVELYSYGKKGTSQLQFRGMKLARSRPQYEGQPSFVEVRDLADEMIQRFLSGQLRTVHVAYTRFVSAGVQAPAMLTLLPLGQPADPSREAKRPGELAASQSEYEFFPDAQTLLNELLPLTIRLRLYQCFLDAMTAEQMARMTAMRLAGDNATEMDRDLTMQYNRARQQGITMELAEIMGGAEALK